MIRQTYIFFLLISLPVYLTAQEEKQSSIDISGYVSDMPSVIKMSADSAWIWENLLHNRLNFGWQMAKNWRFDAGMRNRIIAGNILEQSGYTESVDFDRGWIDFSWNWVETDNLLANTLFDRFYFTFEKDKWNLQIGRQRINWGQTLVWNPNDIFNTYSYFDFDYTERSGCDAFRATYYQTETASTEVAVSVNYADKITVAAMHHWNWENIDFQAIGGLYNQSDMVIGGACSGDFKGLNYRSEFSCFHPTTHFSDTITTVAVSLGADYVFKNSLMLQAEVLYNNVSSTFSPTGTLWSLYAAPISAKYLSMSDWTLFAQASYPITSRLNGTLSGMYFFEVNYYYAGFSIDYSLAENLDLSLISQYFNSFDSAQKNMQSWLGFVRLKYSF